jgi:hypothetical protein
MLKFKSSIITSKPNPDVALVTDLSVDEGVYKFANVSADFLEYVQGLPENSNPPHSPSLAEFMKLKGYGEIDPQNLQKDFENFVSHLKKFNLVD